MVRECVREPFLSLSFMREFCGACMRVRGSACCEGDAERANESLNACPDMGVSLFCGTGALVTYEKPRGPCSGEEFKSNHKDAFIFQ